MYLNHLRAFVAVAGCAHLTRAAERLHLSQPAVSHQIKALEEKLGQRLFERTSNGMELTRVGRQLLEHAEQVLAAVETLLRAAHAIKGEIAGRLRIGTLSDPQFIRLGEFLARAVERYPLLELELRNEFSGAALQKVRGGDLDASFFFGELVHDDVTGQRLGDVGFCVVAPGAWAARVRGADWSTVAAMPWVLPPAISSYHPLLRILFGERGAQPAKLVEADNEGVMANLVESGVGLSLMREELALDRQRAGAVCIWDDAPLFAPLWFIHSAERASDPLIQALLEVLRETWGLKPDGADPARKNAAPPQPPRPDRSR